MKKGFTLLELIVVIIILGVLATLGLTQYARMIERARGAEARAVLGTIRTYAAAYKLEYGNIASIGDVNVGLGTASDQIPSSCRSSHYFRYRIDPADPNITITGTRCSGAEIGKNPQGPSPETITLNSNLNTGVDAWGGTGGY